MFDILYKKYKNIEKCFINYRKLTTTDKFLNKEEFLKTIQIEQYVKHEFYKKNKKILMYLFSENSKYLETTAQFRKLLNAINENPVDAIFITKNPLSIYINKSIISYSNINPFNYLHRLFSIDISTGPLCSKHTILTNSELKDLCSEGLIIHPLSLPSIPISDPQNIWIGGELGEVIKVESVSENTGKVIRYRIVSPDSGKINNIQKLRKSIIKNEEKVVDEKTEVKKEYESDISELDDEYID